MAVIDNLRWMLTADSGPFRQEMSKAERSARGSSRNMSRSFDQLGRSVRNMRNVLLTLVGVGGFGALVNNLTNSADEVGKLSVQLGIAVEDFTTLTFAVEQNGGSQNDLRLALRRLARGIDQANQGAGAYGTKLKELNIETKNVDGSQRAVFDVLTDVGELFSTMPDGARKTALAYELLGDNGTKLIPLLNQGAAGMAAMQERARELGLELSGDGVLAAAEFNDLLAEMRREAMGFAQSLLLEALPSVNQYIRTVRLAAEENGALYASFIALGGLGSALFGESLEQQIRNASNEVARMEAQMLRLQQTAREQGRVVSQSQTRRMQLQLDAAREELQSLEERQRTIEQQERERAAEAARQREEEARRRAAEEAAQQELLEQQAASEAAEAEAAKRIEAGEKVIEGLEREIALFDKLTQTERVRWEIAEGNYAELDAAQQQRILTLTMEREALDANRAAEEAARAEREQAEEQLRRMAEQVIARTRTEAELLSAEMETLSELLQTGHIDWETYGRAVEEAQERLISVAEETETTREAMDSFADQAARNAQDSFANFLFDPFSAGVEGMVLQFADAMRRIISEMLAAQALQSATNFFGGFGFSEGGAVQGFADGGRVQGPGTTTSDSIPARLSRNEFVQPASTAGHYGYDVMEAMRRRALPRTAVRALISGAAGLRPYSPSSAMFNEGGLVSGQGASDPTGGGVRIVNVLDPSVVEEYLTSRPGERLVVNIIQRNRAALST